MGGEGDCSGAGRRRGGYILRIEETRRGEEQARARRRGVRAVVLGKGGMRRDGCDGREGRERTPATWDRMGKATPLGGSTSQSLPCRRPWAAAVASAAPSIDITHQTASKKSCYMRSCTFSTFVIGSAFISIYETSGLSIGRSKCISERTLVCTIPIFKDGEGFYSEGIVG